MNELVIYGTIGATFWDEDYVTASEIRDRLAAMDGGPVTVRLNSGGGIAADGQAIYSLLRNYAGEVHMVIDGVAMSAASLIAMAGDTITMPTGSLMMIHDPAAAFTNGRGTEHDHLEAAAALRIAANAYADAYAARAGITRAAAREIMRAETYFDGPAAIEAGFATATDDSAKAAEAAAFDYAIYAHAPAALTARRPGVRRSKSAVMAMMAGHPAQPPKGAHSMEDQMNAGEDTLAAEGEDSLMPEGEDTLAPEGDDTLAAEGEDTLAAEGEDTLAAEGGPAPTASARPAVADVRALVELSGGSAEDALDYIERGMTMDAITRDLRAKLEQETLTMTGPRARITRDERTTRRHAMTEAIVAQVSGTDPTDRARPFMGQSLAQMAADCAGYRGPLRSAGERIEAFTMASHSTSDFPIIFENAMNKLLLERYEVAQPTYRRIARKRNFSDFRPHNLVRAGDFPQLLEINETGEIKFGTFGENKETAVLTPYGIGLTISRQMMINDDLGAIEEVLAGYGDAIAQFEESTFYAFALSASLSDGNPVFHASHNNLAAAGTAITVAAVSAGRAAIRKQKSLGGQNLNWSPSILLVGPDKETEAEQLVSDIQAAKMTDVNIFSGRLEVVATAEITGNPWYLLCGPERAGAACWTFGYLDGAEAPRLRREEPFGRQGFSMTVEHDFGLGAVDFRGGYKNPGN
ncbi:MAG: Clp protease ClpP [Rhodobacteraceae bacterium]|nr:Clp protease ClpP [Paracoccaceae bacterium]